jgi:hypothetical protein
MKPFSAREYFTRDAKKQELDRARYAELEAYGYKQITPKKESFDIFLQRVR